MFVVRVIPIEKRNYFGFFATSCLFLFSLTSACDVCKKDWKGQIREIVEELLAVKPSYPLKFV